MFSLSTRLLIVAVVTLACVTAPAAQAAVAPTDQRIADEAVLIATQRYAAQDPVARDVTRMTVWQGIGMLQPGMCVPKNAREQFPWALRAGAAIRLTGRFTAPDEIVPPGTPLPTSSDLVLVLEADSLEMHAAGMVSVTDDQLAAAARLTTLRTCPPPSFLGFTGTTKLHVSSRSVRVGLTCGTDPCRGTIELRAGAHRVGTLRYPTMQMAQAATVRVPLTRWARTWFKKHRRLSVTAIAKAGHDDITRITMRLSR